MTFLTYDSSDVLGDHSEIDVSVYKTEEKMIKEIKEALLDQFNRYGFINKNGIDFRRVIIEKMVEGKKEHYYQDKEFRGYLDQLNEANVFFAYCGYDFPAIIGINVDLSHRNIADRDIWAGRNYLGKLLSKL